MTMGQVGGKLVGQIFKAEEFEDAAGLVVCGAFGSRVLAENAADEARFGPAVTTKPDIVEHAQLME